MNQPITEEQIAELERLIAAGPYLSSNVELLSIRLRERAPALIAAARLAIVRPVPEGETPENSVIYRGVLPFRTQAGEWDDRFGEVVHEDDADKLVEGWEWKPVAIVPQTIVDAAIVARATIATKSAQIESLLQLLKDSFPMIIAYCGTAQISEDGLNPMQFSSDWKGETARAKEHAEKVRIVIATNTKNEPK